MSKVLPDRKCTDKKQLFHHYFEGWLRQVELMPKVMSVAVQSHTRSGLSILWKISAKNQQSLRSSTKRLHITCHQLMVPPAGEWLDPRFNGRPSTSLSSAGHISLPDKPQKKPGKKIGESCTKLAKQTWCQRNQDSHKIRLTLKIETLAVTDRWLTYPTMCFRHHFHGTFYRLMQTGHPILRVAPRFCPLSSCLPWILKLRTFETSPVACN